MPPRTGARGAVPALARNARQPPSRTAWRSDTAARSHGSTDWSETDVSGDVLREGDLLAVAASQGGQPTNPAWFHNLKANPETTIQIGSRKRHVRARVATDEERDGLWPKFVAFCPDFEFWQRLANPRKIPIVILEPR